MKSLSKVRRAISLGLALTKVIQQYSKTVNRILTWVLMAAAIGFLACEEHARRTWRDQDVESQENLTQVRKVLFLEREHVKKLCALEELANSLDALAAAKQAREVK